jgi:hypothetical protein
VISNTDRLSKSFRVSYPALPAEHFLLTNGFDDAPSLGAAANPPDSGRLALHLGDIYDGSASDVLSSARATMGIESTRFVVESEVRRADIDTGIAEAAVRDLPEAARGRIQFEPRVSWTVAKKRFAPPMSFCSSKGIRIAGASQVLRVPADR